MAGKEPTQFGGEEHFDVEPARLFAALTDLDTIAATIPDLVSSERKDATTLACVVRPGFSFLRGTLKLTIKLVDQQPPTSAAMQVVSQSIGISMRVDSNLAIEAEPGGSKLTWQATLSEMKGLIASVSPGLVRASADVIIRHAWQQVRERLKQ